VVRTAPWESRAAPEEVGCVARVPARRGREKWRPPLEPLERWSEWDWHRLEQDCGIRKRDAVLREEMREAVHVYSVLIRDAARVSAEEMRAEAAKLALAMQYVADHVSQVVFSEIGRTIGCLGALLVLLVPEVVAGRVTGGDLVLEPDELALLHKRAQWFAVHYRQHSGQRPDVALIEFVRRLRMSIEKRCGPKSATLSVYMNVSESDSIRASYGGRLLKVVQRLQPALPRTPDSIAECSESELKARLDRARNHVQPERAAGHP
jgi:hypothetical protein